MSPEDDLEIGPVHGAARCPHRCSECDGRHHWIENSIDPDDPDEVAEWRAEHPAGRPTEEDLLAHFVCKHCPAWAEVSV